MHTILYKEECIGLEEKVNKCLFLHASHAYTSISWGLEYTIDGGRDSFAIEHINFISFLRRSFFSLNSSTVPSHLFLESRTEVTAALDYSPGLLGHWLVC